MNQDSFSGLKEFGIDVGLLISGLFGAILLTSKKPRNAKKKIRVSPVRKDMD